MIRLLLVVFLFASSAEAIVNTWYVRKSGDDTKDGKSWANAFKTWHSGAVDSAIAGDSVWFGAGRWDTTMIEPPSGGTFSLITTFVDSIYEADGTVGGATISSAEYPGGSWTNSTGSKWWAEWTPTATSIQEANSKKAVNQNDTAMIPRSSVANMTEAGMSYYDDANDTMWVWCWGSVNPNNETMTFSARPSVLMNDSLVDNVLFKGLSFRMGTVGVIAFNQASDSIYFEHCNVYGQWGGWPDNPAVITSVSWQDAPMTHWGYYNTFVACSISQCYPVTGTPPGFETGSEHHRGAGIIAYGQRNFTVDSCVFFDLPAVMITFKNKGNSHSLDQDTSANVVRFSEFIGRPVADSGSGGGITFLCASWQDSAYGNTFINMNRAAILFYQGCESEGGLFIGNNSFYNCSANIRMHEQTTTHRVQDTTSFIRYNYGYERWVGAPNPQGTYEIGIGDIEADSLVAVFAKFDIDSNGWYSTSLNFGYNASKTWAQWQALGADVNGVNTNPSFADPANGDFTRGGASGEMNLTYGGRTWTIFGATQNDSVAVRIEGDLQITGNVRIE